MAATTVQFNAHASLLINSGEHILLTDPWYSVGFSSWEAWPPPAISANVLQGLGRAGKLSVVISHGHDDHLDLDFLRVMPQVDILIPESDTQLSGALAQFPNVTLIPEHRTTRHRGYALQSFPLAHSAIIAIESHDAHILHGNDAHDLPDQATQDIRNSLTNRWGKPIMFCGQGGSASGWPLRYKYPPGIAASKLQAKTHDMIKNLATTGEKLGASYLLAYACFARTSCGDQSWLPIKSTGNYCNDLCQIWGMPQKFVHMNPGDVFLPATGQTLNLLPTFESDEYTPIPALDLKRNWFGMIDAGLMSSFMAEIDPIATSTGVHFEVIVNGMGKWSVGEGPVCKTCRVDPQIMAAVLHREIPFADLNTGFLAEWERKPDTYCPEFLDRVIDQFGFKYFEDKLKDWDGLGPGGA